MAADVPWSGATAAPAARLAALVAGQRRRLVLWVPVMLGVGIGAWFAAPVEPGLGALPWLAALGLMPVLLAAAGVRGVMLALTLAGALGAAGFGAAMARARLVAAPVLAGPVTALVEGRLRAVSQSASGLPRLTLDAVTIYGVEPVATPARVRVTLRRPDHAEGLEPGDRLSVLAMLAPPGGPVAPGAFDFRRLAWFEQLGAIGTARGRVAVLEHGEASGAAVALARVRATLSAGLRAGVGGEAGAFAAAIVTGDRSGLPVDALAALRDSNLAHLLAISGLHMAIVCGLVFGLVRQALVLVPGLALRWPVKAVAAGAGLAAAGAYLLLSGGAVATQRAGLMAAVALGGILAGRPALGLRGLALAAAVILLLTPESLLGVGFQMSFAATLALVAFYDGTRGQAWRRPSPGWRARVLGYGVGVLLTSLIAGLATAPFAAWHFNRLAPWGLVANMAAVPVMGLWVAPLLALAGLVAPLGLETWPLRGAGVGIEWILLVARWVAALPGAVQPLAATGVAPLLLLSAGGLWLCLWTGRLRWAGLVPVVLGFAVWAAVPLPRPVLLVAPFGDLVAVRGDAGLVPDHPRAAGYVADVWLRRDGDAAMQEDAAARPGFAADGPWRSAALGQGWQLWLSRERRVPAAVLLARCGPRTVLLLPRASVASPAGGCLALDARILADGAARTATVARDGALSITVAGGAVRLWARQPGVQ